MNRRSLLKLIAGLFASSAIDLPERRIVTGSHIQSGVDFSKSYGGPVCMVLASDLKAGRHICRRLESKPIITSDPLIPDANEMWIGLDEGVNRV